MHVVDAVSNEYMQVELEPHEREAFERIFGINGPTTRIVVSLFRTPLDSAELQRRFDRDYGGDDSDDGSQYTCFDPDHTPF